MEAWKGTKTKLSSGQFWLCAPENEVVRQDYPRLLDSDIPEGNDSVLQDGGISCYGN